MHLIAILARSGAVALEIAVLHQVFGAAPYKVVDSLLDADTVLVPGIDDPLEPCSDAALDALRSTEARLVSFSSGAFLLGRAGLLDDGQPRIGCSPRSSADSSRWRSSNSAAST